MTLEPSPVGTTLQAVSYLKHDSATDLVLAAVIEIGVSQSSGYGLSDKVRVNYCRCHG